MSKEISEDIGKYYHHYPQLAAIITVRSGGKDNAMAAAWHTPLSFNPPLYGVAVAAKRFTYQLIVRSREFAINFVPASRVELVAAVGGSKGAQVDKFAAFNITKDKSVKTGAPVLTDAYAAYECKLVDDRPYGDHQLLVGEIVAVHYRSEAFTEDEILNLDVVTPVLYLGRDRYITEAKCSLRTLEREVYGQRS